MKHIRRLLRLIQRMLGMRRVLVLGDSHMEVFKHWWFIFSYPFIYWDTYSIAGASLTSIWRKDSKTQAHRIFTKAFEGRAYKQIIVDLGFVDLNGTLWFRIAKYKKPVEVFVEEIFENYTRFITYLGQHGAELVVLSAPLAIIEDDVEWGERENPWEGLRAKQETRIQLICEFNTRMEQWCLEHGVSFVAMDVDVLDRSGKIREEFKPKDIFDPHYLKQPYARLIVKKLKERGGFSFRRP